MLVTMLTPFPKLFVQSQTAQYTFYSILFLRSISTNILAITRLHLHIKTISIIFQYKASHSFNLSFHRYSFYHINNRELLKTLCEKKKLLVTSNFFFSHNVFYSIRKLYQHLSIFSISLFAAELEKLKIGICGEGLILYI